MLLGPYGPYSYQLNFCTRQESNGADNATAGHWPPGKFSVYATDEHCPPGECFPFLKMSRDMRKPVSDLVLY